MAEERVLDTYRSVWNEFYVWETEYASEVIASLVTDTPARDSPSAEDSCLSQDIDILTFRLLKRPLPGIRQSLPRALPVVQVHPRYQACTPSNQNVMAKRPNYNPFVMPLFIPFADEARFQPRNFLEEFLQDSDYTDPKLRWQSLPDPDFEVIQLQAFLKLRNLGYTVSQIDAELVLPQAEIPDTDADGLLWACEQRDLLEFPGMLRNAGDGVPIVEKWDVISRVDSMLRQFCPLLGCIQSACPSHTHDRELNRNVRPTLNNDSLRQRAKKNCNNMCFVVEGNEYIDIAPRELMTKDVISLIKLLPDELPCHLAGLCRLSCRDVFACRSILFSPILASGLVHRDIPSHDPRPPERSWFKDCKPDTPWLGFTAGKACDHEGPCHKPTLGECHCYMRRVHCSRNCPCTKSCFLRWKGCSCMWKRTGPKSSPCQAGKDGRRSKCECQAAFRECDPEVCGKCHARGAIAGIKGYSCANVSLQKGNVKLLEVKAAEYGLGAFATQSIKKDEFIGEYVGEVYYNCEHTSRPYLNRYTGLNYLFDLNKSLALDALTVGNETRYLNHSEDCNVTAIAWFVNDEHRIAYFATKGIAKGKELFLDYGEKYWAEGTFEDYLAEREEGKNSGEGPEQDLEKEYADLTYGSDTA